MNFLQSCRSPTQILAHRPIRRLKSGRDSSQQILGSTNPAVQILRRLLGKIRHRQVSLSCADQAAFRLATILQITTVAAGRWKTSREIWLWRLIKITDLLATAMAVNHCTVKSSTNFEGVMTKAHSLQVKVAKNNTHVRHIFHLLWMLI